MMLLLVVPMNDRIVKISVRQAVITAVDKIAICTLRFSNKATELP